VCNFFAFIKWLLPVLRLAEVIMTGNSLRLTRKILIVVKLMALTIYAEAGLLRPRPGPNITDAAADRPRWF